MTSICEGVLQYTKQLHFISVLVVLQLSKLFIIVFWNVHVLYTYLGMLNSEEKISKYHIDAIDDSISRNRYLITLSNKLHLESIIDTVGVHCKLSHISFI